MKLKSLLFVCLFSMLSSVFADSRHVHPKADAGENKSAAVKNAFLPGYCEIEIANYSERNVTVYGTFDDNSTMTPFNIYSGETPHYISLYYYGYCHASMWLDIYTFRGQRVYAGYTGPGQTVTIYDLLGNAKSSVKTK
ncbi:hypothetical protein ACFORL_06465 [Legionella dresdenensis]|uniref:Secreted protein n=1 Tax=Legionella dresdenensis TaxID=450200 RepID=A0ABV8CEF3_9GAMM